MVRTASPTAAPRARARRATTRVRRAAPRRGSATPDAPGFMATLNREHRYIASLIEALAEQADRLLPGKQPDYAMLHDMIRYMADYPDAFHHPRENLLFGRLVVRDPGMHGAVVALLDGHREIAARSRELLAALAAVVAGRARPDKRRLKVLCDRYIGRYWDHLNAEEGEVFPHALATLRADDWAVIAAKAEYVDDPLFGGRVGRDYRRLSGFLGERVQRAGTDVALAGFFGIEGLIEAVATLGTTVGEVGDIARRHLRHSLLQSAGVMRARIRARDCRGLALLPLAVGGVMRQEVAAGAGEIRASVGRARRELVAPVVQRLRYLRKLAGGTA